MLILLMLLCFIGQASASVVMSCSNMSAMSHMNSQVTSDGTKALSQMDHSSMVHNTMDHSQHNMAIDESQTNVANVHSDDCCGETCLCDMINCSANNVIFQSSLISFHINLVQKNNWFIEQYPQFQYLNYLFKPPIQA